MKRISILVVLSAVVGVGYVTYTMQPSEAGPADLGASQAGPASAGQARASGAGAVQGSRVPSLQQMSAEVIAREIHDNEVVFPEGVTTPEQKQQAIDGMFYYEGWKKLIADAYCRLYPQEIARQMHERGNFVAGVTMRFDKLSENVQEVVAKKYAQLYTEEFKEFKPRLVQTIPGSFAVWGGIAFTPDGSLLVDRSDQHNMQVWQWMDNEFRVIQDINDVQRSDEVVVSSQNNWFARFLPPYIRVYAKGNNNRFVVLQEIPTDEFSFGGIVLGVGSVSENNKVIAAAYNNRVRAIRIFAQRNSNAVFENVQEIPYQSDTIITSQRDEIITSIRFDSTGTRFASASYNGTVRIWSLHPHSRPGSFSRTSILRPPVDRVRGWGAVRFSPDNRFIVLGAGTEIVIWRQTSSGNFELFQHIPNAHEVGNRGNRGISFNPDDSNCFASAASDGVKVWYLSKNSNTFRQLYVIPGYANKVSFGPDGKLAVALNDSIQIWDLNPPLEMVHVHLLKKVIHEEIKRPSDMPASQEMPQSLVAMPSQQSEQNVVAASSSAGTPPAQSPTERLQVIEVPAGVAQSSADRLRAIDAEKKAIKANSALSREQKEEQLNILRAEERELKRQCQSQGTSCTVQ